MPFYPRQRTFAATASSICALALLVTLAPTAANATTARRPAKAVKVKHPKLRPHLVKPVQPRSLRDVTTTFIDDFNGPAGSLANTSLWTYQTGGNWGNGQELQQYTDRAVNASLTGRGSLLVTARGETYTGWDKVTRDYTSARLMSKRSVLYGTVAARIRLSSAQGAWPAFWAVGANYAQVGWPACGELDVMEAVNQLPNLYGSFHGPYTSGPRYAAYNQGKMISPPNGLGTGWHTYSAQWDSNTIAFSLDGVPYVSVERKSLPADQIWAMDNSQNLVLNVAVGGMAGTPADPSAFGATMEVDWVRVTSA
jgi:beta-glucanase (GH16 family)